VSALRLLRVITHTIFRLISVWVGELQSTETLLRRTDDIARATLFDTVTALVDGKTMLATEDRAYEVSLTPLLCFSNDWFVFRTFDKSSRRIQGDHRIAPLPFEVAGYLVRSIPMCEVLPLVRRALCRSLRRIVMSPKLHVAFHIR